MNNMKVLVACFDSNGIPTLQPVLVALGNYNATDGIHYAAAVRVMREANFNGPYVAIDQFDIQEIPGVFELFDWTQATLAIAYTEDEEGYDNK